MFCSWCGKEISEQATFCKHCGRQVQPAKHDRPVSPGMTGMKWGNNNGPVQTSEPSSRVHTRMVISLVLLGIAALVICIAAIGGYRSCYNTPRWFDDDDIMIALLIYFILPAIVVSSAGAAVVEFNRKKDVSKRLCNRGSSLLAVAIMIGGLQLIMDNLSYSSWTSTWAAIYIVVDVYIDYAMLLAIIGIVVIALAATAAQLEKK